MPLTAYRYPDEGLIFGITLLALLVILGLTAGLTLCLAPLMVLVFVVIAYLTSRSRHQELMQAAVPITLQRAPELAALTAYCARILRIPSNQVEFFIARSRARNAYTFGLSDPKIVVIYSSLIEEMRPEELRFIFGHELGHVALGHTWLNSLLGGMAGIPTTFEGALLLTLVFRWWNRACEYSADRAGLLACGSLQAATTALVKLVAGQVHNQAELQRAIALIEQEDDLPLNVLAETLSTHPMIVRRLAELKKYAASEGYRRLQVQVNRQAAAGG